MTSAQNSMVSLTPRDVASILFRHSRMATACFGLVIVATLLFAVFSARYESHFKVLLRHGRFNPVVSSQPDSPMDVGRPDISEEELNSEVELLRDEDLLKRVAESAGLVPQTVLGPDRPPAIENAARELGRHLDVEALKKSNLIQVSYRDRSSERAARILLALAAAYIQRHTDLERPHGEIQFFDKQTSEYESKLRQSESNLVHFTRARGVASAALERDITLQKLGEAQAASRQLDQDGVESDRRISSLEEQLKLFPSRSVTEKRWADNPEILEKMKTHLLELQLKRTELLGRFEPSYRVVQEVEQQIAETKTSITAEELTPVRDETTDKDPNYEWARMEMEKAQVQRDGMQARQLEAAQQLHSLRGVAQQMQSDAIDQQDLIRTAKANEETYLLYLHKREEARIGDALDQQSILNVAIVEPPVAPALPVHSLPIYGVLALGLATVFSVSTAFALDYFDPTIRTPDEACKLLDVPVLAWLPPAETSIRPPSLRTSNSKGARP